MIEVTRGVTIADGEVLFATSRSGGPGGQNVNKVETRVTLFFDLAGSASLSEAEKQRIRSRLATRISKDGVLRVVAQQHRTQHANREEALRRFVALLQGALAEARPRKATRATAASRERRLAAKKLRSRLKERRAERGSWHE